MSRPPQVEASAERQADKRGSSERRASDAEHPVGPKCLTSKRTESRSLFAPRTGSTMIEAAVRMRPTVDEDGPECSARAITARTIR